MKCLDGRKVRPDEGDVRMDGTPEWKVCPDEGDVQMKGTPPLAMCACTPTTPEFKGHVPRYYGILSPMMTSATHASILGKEDERHVGAVKINPTEICLNKLAPSVGPVIQSTKAKNDGSLFLFDFSKTFVFRLACSLRNHAFRYCAEGHVYDVRHASFGIVHGGPHVRPFEMVPSASCPLDCIRYMMYNLSSCNSGKSSSSGNLAVATDSSRGKFS
ncbi:hypothetical protein Tco_1194223 [Tanacetum coccineum]